MSPSGSCRSSAKPVFDDHQGTYWYKDNETGSVKVTDTNTRISIIHQPRDGSTITVQVGASHH